jgi:hypothetical protein
VARVEVGMSAYPWADQCAQYERGSIGLILAATKCYRDRQAEGWSLVSMGKVVTEAGFPISHQTIARRLRALAKAEAEVEGRNAALREDDFAKTYAEENARTRAVVGLPKNEQGRAILLQDLIQALVKEDKYDPEGLADLVGGEARAIRRAGAPKREPKTARIARSPLAAFKSAGLFVHEGLAMKNGEPLTEPERIALEVLRLDIDVALSEIEQAAP